MWLDKIIALWSPTMRETIELSRLNRIWERFNNEEDIEEELCNQDWKYHYDKVLLLKEYIKIFKNSKKSKTLLKLVE